MVPQNQDGFSGNDFDFFIYNFYPKWQGWYPDKIEKPDTHGWDHSNLIKPSITELVDYLP